MTIKHILPSHVHAVIDQQVCFTKGNKNMHYYHLQLVMTAISAQI